MNARIIHLAPAILVGILACGGKADGTPAQSAKLDTAEAQNYTAAFLDRENHQAAEASLPAVEPAGEALALTYPAAPACATSTPITPTSVKWTFVNCTGPHGWTWNGAIVISWQTNADGSVLVKHDNQNMVGTKEGRSWTINGVKDILRNPATKVATLTAEPGFTKTFSDGTRTVAFSYACSLTADHSVEGQRKLWGTWSLTPQAAAAGEGASGTISKDTPLFWDRGTGCCHPVSGTLALTRGSRSATLVFGLPCGTVTINGETKTLGACR